MYNQPLQPSLNLFFSPLPMASFSAPGSWRAVLSTFSLESLVEFWSADLEPAFPDRRVK